MPHRSSGPTERRINENWKQPHRKKQTSKKEVQQEKENQLGKSLTQKGSSSYPKSQETWDSSSVGNQHVNIPTRNQYKFLSIPDETSEDEQPHHTQPIIGDPVDQLILSVIPPPSSHEYREEGNLKEVMKMNQIKIWWTYPLQRNVGGQLTIREGKQQPKYTLIWENKVLEKHGRGKIK